MSEWISVKDRLPGELEDVAFVYTGNEVCDDFEYIHGQWYEDGYECEWNLTDCVITHWMPLPKPPQKL